MDLGLVRFFFFLIFFLNFKFLNKTKNLSEWLSGKGVDSLSASTEF